MRSTLNATVMVVTTWSVPRGSSASALIYSTAVTGRKTASTRWRARAALFIDFSSGGAIRAETSPCGAGHGASLNGGYRSVTRTNA